MNEDAVHRGFRALKETVLGILKSPDFVEPGPELLQLPLMKVINTLFPLLYQGDQEAKRRAVTTLGFMVSALAETDMDGARNIVRRLMWNLNDESGGIGWGSPEAMGEILARHEGLAREYANILASYTREDGNYLENEVLQQGLLWAIGRALGQWPGLIRAAEPHILPYVNSGNAAVRGLAAELLGELQEERAQPALERLLRDASEFSVPMSRDKEVRRVKDVAREALRRLQPTRETGSEEKG